MKEGLVGASIAVLAGLLTTAASAAVSWTATPFNPPSVPLAVRSPYLSAWLPQGSGTPLNGQWPQFWAGQILGWAGYFKVDGTTYTFLGDPSIPNTSVPKSTQKSLEWTATQSTFIMSAGGVDLTVHFLSPVEPNDLVKQSIPFSYITLSAASSDGNPHHVQVYTDISAEWVSGDNGLIANWTTTTGRIVTHQVQLQVQTTFAEINDHIQHGSAYYSTSTTNGLTYQTGADTTLRAQFVANGVLTNTRDTNFRAINDHWPVFAFAHDLGSVTSASTPILLSVGHVRDPVIQYVTAGNIMQSRSSYFWTAFNSVPQVISAFHADYSAALSRARALDAKLQSDAVKISEKYAAIAALSIRQTLAAFEITVPAGTLDKSNTKSFMKEISSNGNMNTVDVIFPAWPAFLYLNPELGKLLLLPLFDYQKSGLYPNKWSIHDMGAHYPNATGHNDGGDETMPLEESGNMLMMVLSHYQRTKDRSLIDTYSGLLRQWTEFLIDEALIPAEQLSTDDFAGHLVNQTNLAIKGIIGIRAMGEIATLLGDEEASANYITISKDYVERWQPLAYSKDKTHLTLSYGNDASWSLSYNLYGEKLIGIDLFPQSVYDTQTAWYLGLPNDKTYGLPLDTRHTYTKTDWEIYMAALLSNTSTQARDLFINGVYNYASDGVSGNFAPFSDWYETLNGTPVGFRARPVAGGHLAFLVL